MKEDHIERVNKILNYIDENLDEELSLAIIANVAFYSPFHLHRLFKSVTSETLNTYITRKRIEKSAAILIHRPEITITELSLKYGFTSNSSFTRAFKKFYGVSPLRFRRSAKPNFSKISQVKRKNGQEQRIFEDYICSVDHHKDWIKMNANVEIKELPQLSVAYLTQIGLEGLDNAFARLLKWAATKRLLDNPEVKVIRIYHDSFRITGPDKVRMSIGVMLKEPIAVSGEIGLTTIEHGKFIVGHFEIEPKDFELSWTALFVWMNENGYRKGAANPFEVIHNNFNEHPEKKCIVDLYIPVI